MNKNLTVKVSDHAMYCTKYDHHYYIDGNNGKIPLRWMAWEAVLLVSSNHFDNSRNYLYYSKGDFFVSSEQA